MAELAAKRPRTAGIGAAALQPTIQVLFEANTHAEAPARQPQDTPSSAAAASTSIASASDKAEPRDEAEPRLLCKRGDSLAALQRAGMLEPSPTDSSSTVWYTGKEQQGVCIVSKDNPERMANHLAGGAAPTAGVSHSQPPALSRSTSNAMVVDSSTEEESEDESGDQLSGEAAQGQEQRLLRAEEDRIRKAFRPLHKCVLCRQHRGTAMHATLGAGQWLANTPAPILPPPLCRKLLRSGMFRLETEQWHALLPPKTQATSWTAATAWLATRESMLWTPWS